MVATTKTIGYEEFYRVKVRALQVLFATFPEVDDFTLLVFEKQKKKDFFHQDFKFEVRNRDALLGATLLVRVTVQTNVSGKISNFITTEVIAPKI